MVTGACKIFKTRKKIVVKDLNFGLISVECDIVFVYFVCFGTSLLHLFIQSRLKPSQNIPTTLIVLHAISLLGIQYIGKSVGVKHTMLPEGQIATVAFNVLAQPRAPETKETEIGAALFTKNGD